MSEKNECKKRNVVICIVILFCLVVLGAVIINLSYKSDDDSIDVSSSENDSDNTFLTEITVSVSETSIPSEVSNSDSVKSSQNSDTVMAPEDLNPMLANIEELYPNSRIEHSSESSEILDVTISTYDSVTGMALKPDINFIKLDFDGGTLIKGRTINEFISSASNVWFVEKSRVNDVLKPRQETYVYLYSNYWSDYRTSADVVTNNGDICIFVYNDSDVALNISDCKIKSYSVSYSDLILDKFTKRPEINYYGLTWGMSLEDAGKIIDFKDAERSVSNSVSSYVFDVKSGYKVVLSFDVYNRFSGVAVSAIN